MSRAASLDSAAINVSAFREDGRSQLEKILRGVPGDKWLVLDDSLGGPLNLIVTDSQTFFSKNGVKDIVKLNWSLTRGSTPPDVQNFVYLIRPTIENARIVAEHVLNLSREEDDYHFNVIFCPPTRAPELDVDLIPFDSDILSLELPNAYKECHLEGDFTTVKIVAHSLLKLESLFGSVPTLRAKGDISKRVCDMFLRLRREDGRAAEDPRTDPEISELILIDRQVDMITPMLTPLTYEALLDEIMGIENTYVSVDMTDAELQSLSGGKGPVRKDASRRKTLALNGDDSLFVDIRDAHIHTATQLLADKASGIQTQYKGTKQLATISEIHDFVKKIPGMQQTMRSLNWHLALVERVQQVTNSPAFNDRWQTERRILDNEEFSVVVEYISACIAREEPMNKVLRLLCLLSLVGNGLKQKHFDFFRKEILQCYGYDLLLTLDHLERCGLFTKRQSNGPWSSLCKSLRLLQEVKDVVDPVDVAYVTSGFAPICARLVEHAIVDGSWRGISEQLRQLPGAPPVEMLRKAPGDGKATSGGGGEDAEKPSRRVILVYFIGGVTYLEIAALRFLSVKYPVDIVIATTQVTSGKKLISTLFEELVAGLPEDSHAEEEEEAVKD